MRRSGCGARRGWSRHHQVAKKALLEFSPPAVESRLDRMEMLVQRVVEERRIMAENTVARSGDEESSEVVAGANGQDNIVVIAPVSMYKFVATGAVPKVPRQRRDRYQLERVPGESDEAWESRLAVADLERTVASVKVTPEQSVHRLRLRQEFELEYRNRNPPRLENYVSRVSRPIPKPSVSHLPKEATVVEVCAIEVAPAPASASSRIGGKKLLPAVLSGIMFKGLDPIVTDLRVDPPMRSCFNCWQRGHRLSDCLKE